MRPGRSCAPGPTKATSGRPSCGRAAGRTRRPGGVGARADIGEGMPPDYLAGLWPTRGDLDELRARADIGEVFAALRLADLLAERGDLEGLRARADVGDADACERLVRLLNEQAGLKKRAIRRFG